VDEGDSVREASSRENQSPDVLNRLKTKFGSMLHLNM